MDHPADFRDLFDNAPCGYLILDNRGRIMLVNETLRSWLQLGDEDLLGKRLLDLLPVAGRVFYETHFAPLLRMQGYFHEVALDLVGKDRVRIPVLANASQRVDPDGKVEETRLALFQAKSRRKYERELFDANLAGEKAREEVESLNVALTETGLLRDEFIAILGHDLRNPLASIGAGMRLLAKEELTSKGRQVTDLIEGSVARMSRLIDDVLDFTRGRMGGGLNVDRRKEDELHLHLEQVASELITATDRQVDVDIYLPKPLFVDAGRIGQLVSNLLGNALSHGAEDTPVEFSAQMDGASLVISVSNGGDPIPSEVVERLFQPFFRGGHAAGRHEQGLGLGLHIACEIAKAHGGTLTVSSSIERTTFEFRMPANEA
ncbi:PAS domain-containing sensor histidine kinase [Pseudorhizobium pelagicum]|uniref:histidine kinase n=1 Tax=Pseudorhizobium pelagicum TaxID=1509405 RepID=A0A922P0E7_9HYPH|nr:PAS domain-containing sensor histidine kinase [Pseudorhizobium pelagicum]KEQ02953.1 histidine kinase [Pseudorhizobium pelagicum]KEQ03127.1 histidine kinase [Pseudorhizobium pelagicum]